MGTLREVQLRITNWGFANVQGPSGRAATLHTVLPDKPPLRDPVTPYL